jgi:hypothetical protein
LQRFESLLLTPATILVIPLKAGLKRGVANDQTVHRTGWIVFIRPKRRKTKAHQCFNRCTCNRVQSTRFVWQEIKRTRPRFRSGLRQLLIFTRQRTLAGKRPATAGVLIPKCSMALAKAFQTLY